MVDGRSVGSIRRLWTGQLRFRKRPCNMCSRDSIGNSSWHTVSIVSSEALTACPQTPTANYSLNRTASNDC